MAEWVFLTGAPPTEQVVTAGTADAAARKAGAYVARNMEGDGASTFNVWVLGGPALEYDVVVETKVNRTVTVTPTPPIPIPPVVP